MVASADNSKSASKRTGQNKVWVRCRKKSGDGSSAKPGKKVVERSGTPSSPGDRKGMGFGFHRALIVRGRGDRLGSRATFATRKTYCMKYLALVPIRFYQIFISPALPSTCRFVPSCSQYAVEAITCFGLFKGGWLGLKRILRCHPFNPGGYDPVPFD